MIATLTGKVERVSGESCILEVNGVGYLVQMSLPSLEKLSRVTELIKLYTYFQMREDGVSLFGFLSPDEQSVFQKIISVSGVGPKIGLAVLGRFTPDELRAIIQREDHQTLTSVSGVGLKTAQRLVLELKGKLGNISNSETSSFDPVNSNTSDAIDALIALGYPNKEAQQIVESIASSGERLTTPELVRKALQHLGRK